MKALMLGLTAALLAMLTPAIADQRGPRVLVPGPLQTRAVSYGPAPRQKATLYTRGQERAPLVVYLHGGGWSAGSPGAGANGLQAAHFTRSGYAYATVGYRFVPAVTVEAQLADTASAIALLRREPGVDPERLILIGHSSGAHLAALLGTDPTYLGRARVPFHAVRAVVLLDPAVLNVPAIIGQRGGTIERFFRPAFGDDPARQSALSPTRNAEPPNAPRWLSLHDAGNLFAASQSAELAAALIGAGAQEASILPIQSTTHLRLNNEIGAPGDTATAAIDAFLARAVPETRRPRFR